MSDHLRLGALLAAVLLGCAQSVRAVVSGRRARGTRRRLGNLFPVAAPSPPRARSGLPAWAGKGAAALGAAGLGWVLFGVFGGLVAGALAGAAVRRGAVRRSAPSGDEDAAVRDLPLAADLLAACASAGAGPGEAAEAVGRSLGGPLGERLTRTAAELRLGGEPAEVWRRFGAIPGALGLARCMERAGSSGAPAAEAVARQATALRAVRARAAAVRARRAQVLISAPVGLCFLPAFLAVGVAPVVIGLATGLLDG
ncbi:MULTISPECIES: type II secretion system F family protein [unclassified Streptomyces]|uniref:type II secretion system F family protein n=1 Tax=unclassified Streptomyces TaxID=2593676 RepID=UPI0006FFFC36|nr:MULTISPECIES: type II secretion system F family protein [unclassified Streptomyces]KQX45584.1 type II secretion protein F [Streptomyces sp. Root1304]KRA79528.1 type II secretion protein F [Streptomyces sp. Root66D1]